MVRARCCAGPLGTERDLGPYSTYPTSLRRSPADAHTRGMALDTAPAGSTPDVDLDHQRPSDDRSFLGWVAVVLALAALVLGFVALGDIRGEEGDSVGAATGGEVAYLDI